MKNIEVTSLNEKEMAQIDGGSLPWIVEKALEFIVDHLITGTIEAEKNGYTQSSGSKLMNTALH